METFFNMDVDDEYTDEQYKKLFLNDEQRRKDTHVKVKIEIEYEIIDEPYRDVLNLLLQSLKKKKELYELLDKEVWYHFTNTKRDVKVDVKYPYS
jgi:hypothetical protein